MENTFYFSPPDTFIDKVVVSPVASFFKQGKKLGSLILILDFLSILFCGYQYFTNSLRMNNLLLGLVFILFPLSLFLYYISFFFKVRLSKQRFKILLDQSNLSGNLASFLDYQSAKIIHRALKLYKTKVARLPVVALSIALSDKKIGRASCRERV